MQIAIVDDEPVMGELLSDNIRRVAQEMKLGDIKISFTANAEGLLKDTQVYDIYFLDVELGSINGIDLAKRLRRQGIDSPIAFISSYEEYVWDSFPAEPYAFIRKGRLEEELGKVLPRLLRGCVENEEEVVITIGSNEVTFHPDRVIYFNSFDHYIKIVERQASVTPLMFRGKLDNIQKQVVAYGFIRTHERYLVNLEHVMRIMMDELYMRNGENVPISRKYKKDVQVAIHRLIQRRREGR